jgi:hypothetical protein
MDMLPEEVCHHGSLWQDFTIALINLLACQTYKYTIRTCSIQIHHTNLQYTNTGKMMKFDAFRQGESSGKWEVTQDKIKNKSNRDLYLSLALALTLTLPRNAITFFNRNFPPMTIKILSCIFYCLSLHRLPMSLSLSFYFFWPGRSVRYNGRWRSAIFLRST